MLLKLSFGSPVHDALTSKKDGPWEMGTLQRAGRSRWVDHPRTGGIGPRTRTMNRTWLVLSDFGYLAKKYLIYRTTIFDFEWFLRDVVGVLSSVSVLLAEFRSFSAETLITYNLYWCFFAGNSLQIPGESCFAIQGDFPTCCWIQLKQPWKWSISSSDRHTLYYKWIFHFPGVAGIAIYGYGYWWSIESYRLQNWSIATNGLRSYGNGSPTDIDIENILEHQKYLHELSYGNKIAISCQILSILI